MGQNTNRDIKSFAIDNQGNTIDVVLNTDERFQTTTTLEERVEYLEQALGALLTQDGNVRIQKGGTSADNATDAVGNLVGGLPALSELTDEDYDIIVGRKRMTDMGAYKTTATALSDFIEGKLPPIPEPTQDFFTYIVDSNQKLADWANNVSGNDYTSVLIKTGEWGPVQPNGRINLTATGTKVIVGQPGNLLVFNDYAFGDFLFYEEIPQDTSNYKIYNVNIKYKKNTSIGTTNSAFSKCVNIEQCSYTVENLLTGQFKMTAFSACENIVDSNIFIDLPNTANINNLQLFYESSNISGCSIYLNAKIPANAYVFSQCENIRDCYIRAFANSTAMARLYGFMNCKYIFDCDAELSGTTDNTYMYSFEQCDNIERCNVTTIVMSNATARCYDNCKYLTGCSGKVEATGYSPGAVFVSCHNIINCNGDARQTTENNLSANAFSRCYGVYRCSALVSDLQDNSYSSCYFSSQSTATATYACANTLEGGWNDTTIG